MQNKPTVTNSKPSSKTKETYPKGNKVVKNPADKVYKKKAADSKYANPAKIKENQEQPVHPIKNPPKD